MKQSPYLQRPSLQLVHSFVRRFHSKFGPRLYLLLPFAFAHGPPKATLVILDFGAWRKIVGCKSEEGLPLLLLPLLENWPKPSN